ncbi:MAG: hypothetical protein M3R67_07430 [Acidobacteriota bacterium]|nr:hypothetical protein [Acidobacteriota bacterium]
MSATTHARSNKVSVRSRPLHVSQRTEGFDLSLSDRNQLQLQKQVDSIIKGIKGSSVAEAIQHVFISLSRVRDVLRIVEINVDEGGSLPVTLAAFSLVDKESKSLVHFIERHTSKIKSIKGPLRHALDGTSFALRHELKRVFGHDLAAIHSELQADEVRPTIMRAHGLLSNCFEQSTLTLVRVFDPSVSGQILFYDFRNRLEQSTVLLNDLSSLMQLTQQAEDRPGAETSSLLIRNLKAFCDGTMHSLMYKDWDEFEDIAREVTSSYGSARHTFILHCFATYLDALINQVGMRGVLNQQSPARRQRKPAKKTRRRRR